MLAGRKLLLADDSITIQKVVDLTFADEGVKVITVSNGKEAIDILESITPDVVLADVFMPMVNGYQVCEYIKQNEKLKHIPVMLLVGSFEPFDEAEARRVGADDILTKPFQSIRRLIDKVGGLLGNRPSDEAPTAELPQSDGVTEEPERLSTQEIELTTADTQPLPDELKSLATNPLVAPKVASSANQKLTDEKKMETSPDALVHDQFATGEPPEELLDLGEFAGMNRGMGEEFVLDLEMADFDEAEPVPFTAGTVEARDYSEVQSTGTNGHDEASHIHESERGWELERSETTGRESALAEQLASTQEFARPDLEKQADEPPALVRVIDNPDDFAPPTESSFQRPVQLQTESKPASVSVATTSSEKITLEQLSPEAIDAIARRAVELLSDKVVQEIAWEVVPELSALMIKRQLEEKKT